MVDKRLEPIDMDNIIIDDLNTYEIVTLHTLRTTHSTHVVRKYSKRPPYLQGSEQFSERLLEEIRY